MLLLLMLLHHWRTALPPPAGRPATASAAGWGLTGPCCLGWAAGKSPPLVPLLLPVLQTQLLLPPVAPVPESQAESHCLSMHLKQHHQQQVQLQCGGYAAAVCSAGSAAALQVPRQLLLPLVLLLQPQLRGWRKR